MTELCCFLVGCLVVKIITRYQMIKLLNQLCKVCETGDEMWQNGVKYAMDQIMEMF